MLRGDFAIVIRHEENFRKKENGVRKICGFCLFLVCVVFDAVLSANVVSIDLDFHTYLNNYYRADGTLYTLCNDAENTNVSAYCNDWHTYYNGGSDFQYNNTEQRHQLAAIFFDRYYQWGAIENWTNNYIIGTIGIGTNSSYPIGSTVLLEVYYEGVTLDNFPAPQYQNKGLGVYTNYYSNTIYEISGDQKQDVALNLVAGQQYDFYVYFNAGCSYIPFTEGLAAGVLFDFTVIPEPSMLLLLGFGVPIVSGLRKRKYS